VVWTTFLIMRMCLSVCNDLLCFYRDNARKEASTELLGLLHETRRVVCGSAQAFAAGTLAIYLTCGD